MLLWPPYSSPGSTGPAPMRSLDVAGVTWGVIQHYFGTREALMLAVLQDGARRFAEVVEDAHVEGDTPEQRVEHLMDILTSHYGQPEFLAYLQVLLNMDHDPRTSVEVRKTMREVSARSQDHVRRLLREGLGPGSQHARPGHHGVPRPPWIRDQPTAPGHDGVRRLGAQGRPCGPTATNPGRPPGSPPRSRLTESWPARVGIPGTMAVAGPRLLRRTYP